MSSLDGNHLLGDAATRIEAKRSAAKSPAQNGDARHMRVVETGQSTAVIVSIRGGVLSGASVGDSGAWLVHATEAIDLTVGQSRKPLVGAGGRPWRIPATPLGDGTLLVASDGLFRYAQRAAILRMAAADDLAAAAQALIGLVRLPTGALQDDAAVVLCRERRIRAAADDVRSERDRTFGGVRLPRPRPDQDGEPTRAPVAHPQDVGRRDLLHDRRVARLRARR